MYKVFKQGKYEWVGFIGCFEGSLNECEKEFNELTKQGIKAKIIQVKVKYGAHERVLIKKNF